jgi:hypothetical protein
LQSGHAVGALLCTLLEDVPALVPMLTTRLILNLARPVPMAPLRRRTEVLREGKKLQILRASLLDGDDALVDLTAVRVRICESPLPLRSRSYPGPGAAQPLPRTNIPRSYELRSVGRERPSGTTVWMRMNVDLFPGREASPLARAMCLADFGGMLCRPLDRSHWSHPNFDLTMHVFREPTGPWVLLDAETETAGLGMSLVTGALADEQGVFGHAHQSLIVERVPRT